MNVHPRLTAPAALYQKEGRGCVRSVLDEGGVVICSVGPGDFTTEGHYILIRDYDENGFLVNDPNSRQRSAMEWSYERLAPQIKNLWALYA